MTNHTDTSPAHDAVDADFEAEAAAWDAAAAATKQAEGWTDDPTDAANAAQAAGEAWLAAAAATRKAAGSNKPIHTIADKYGCTNNPCAFHGDTSRSAF